MAKRWNDPPNSHHSMCTCFQSRVSYLSVSLHFFLSRERRLNFAALRLLAPPLWKTASSPSFFFFVFFFPIVLSPLSGWYRSAPLPGINKGGVLLVPACVCVCMYVESAFQSPTRLRWERTCLFSPNRVDSSLISRSFSLVPCYFYEENLALICLPPPLSPTDNGSKKVYRFQIVWKCRLVSKDECSFEEQNKKPNLPCVHVSRTWLFRFPLVVVVSKCKCCRIVFFSFPPPRDCNGGDNSSSHVINFLNRRTVVVLSGQTASSLSTPPRSADISRDFVPSDIFSCLLREKHFIFGVCGVRSCAPIIEVLAQLASFELVRVCVCVFVYFGHERKWRCSIRWIF